MNGPEPAADMCVVLTPRASGGHEVSLFGWLADAVRDCGLRPVILAPTPALAEACRAAGLALWHPPQLRPTVAHKVQPSGSRPQLLRALSLWPADKPLLLAPGVLHADAWLLAAAIVLRRQVWVYVPTTYTAVRLGYRAGRLRDVLLAPWLRRVHAWITIDARHARQLKEHWHVKAPAYPLPNVARVAPGEPPPWPAPAADGRLRVAFVGRFDMRTKGLDWLIDVLTSHPKWIERFRWLFQGRGPGELALLDVSRKLGPQHVAVHAYAPLDEALSASDVLLLTSRYEGLPLVALEATARGWPIAACRGLGLDELLPPGSLFDFGDAAGLARALESLRPAPARAAAVAYARSNLQAMRPEERYRMALRSIVRALTHSTATSPAC